MSVEGGGVQGVCMGGGGGGSVKSVQAEGTCIEGCECWYGLVEEGYMCCHTRFVTHLVTFHW